MRLPVLIGGARQSNAYTFGTVGNARFLKPWSKKTNNGITSVLLSKAGDAIGVVVWLGHICVTFSIKFGRRVKCGNGRGEIVDNGGSPTGARKQSNLQTQTESDSHSLSCFHSKTQSQLRADLTT